MQYVREPRRHQDVLKLFVSEKSKNTYLKVSAPMVRYSKLEFRKLVREYGVQLCFTPMIIADSFNQSEKARQNEFTTCRGDTPLIAQFAANNASELVNAAQLIYPYVDGVDINCGCPQSWAISKGYGCGLLKEPERMHDMVCTIRRTLPTNFSCSLKIRLLNDDVRSTVELARRLEHCGATFLTIHGRTQWQKCSHSLNVEAMTEVKKSVQIPIIVNGNVRNCSDANQLYNATNADGVMSARGLLANPALFDEQYHDGGCTPLKCVQSWLNIAAAAGEKISFQCFHHHLTFMWSKQMTKSQRLQFNNFSRKAEVFSFFDELYDLRPLSPHDIVDPFVICTYNNVKDEQKSQQSLINDNLCISPQQRKDCDVWASTNGKYFLEFSQSLMYDTNTYDLEKSFFVNL